MYIEQKNMRDRLVIENINYRKYIIQVFTQLITHSVEVS